MFLNWPESLGLLNTRNDSNILGLFPYNVRKTVLASVVERLEDTTNCKPQIFTTPAHARWLMEVVAQGFTLHMEDLPIIEKCISTYTKWLLGGPEDKPPGLVLEETFFRGEMIGHLSFLFEPRSGTSDTALTVQTRLCKDVLDNIILTAAHKLRTVMTPAIWDIWLRLLIGIVDSIFMNKAKTTPPMHNLLCKALSAPAFRVLLEVLLLSQNRDPAIWNSVVGLAGNWIRVYTVQHWCSAANALTLRALALIYGAKFGGTSSANLLIDWIVEDKGSVKSTLAQLDHDFVFFAWRRMVALLPEPQSFTEPEVHRMFFSGVSRMVDHYIKVMELGPHDPRASKQKLPNGNTILALVGRWLFNSLLADKAGFEDGNSIAAATVCKLFCRTPATPNEAPFQKEHLAAFYAVLSRILIKPHNDKVLLTVLLSTKNIFLREYPGSDLTIPNFLYAGASLWREPGTDPKVRASFIELISSLVCASDHFGETKIVSKLHFEIAYGSSQRVSPVIAQFSTLRQHFQVMLSTALSKEDNPRNIIRLMGVIVAFLYEYSRNCKTSSDRETYTQFASSTLNEVVRRCRDGWGSEVVTQAYQYLSNMADLTSTFGNNAVMITKLVIGSVSEHISLLTTMPPKNEDREAIDRMIHRALLTLTDWWLTDPNLPSTMDSKTIQAAIRAIVACLGLPGKSYNPPAIVKLASEFALHHLTVSASFPHPVGPQRVSSEISEEDIMAVTPHIDSTDPTVSQHVRYFVLDEHIIMCLIDVPRPMPAENPKQEPQLCDVYVVLRDSTGRYVWKTNASFYERPEALNAPYDNSPSETVTKEPVIPDRYELNIQQELYSDLLGYLNSLRSDRLYPGGLIAHSEAFVAAEKAHLKSTSYKLDVDIKYKLAEYKPPHETALRFHAARVLLANLGFAHPDTYGRLVPLDSRPGLQTAIRALDSSVERSVMSVGVVLLQSVPKKPYEYLADESAGPQDYQDFLTSLGWGIHLWDHTGYRGPLVPSSTGDYAPYYSNYSTEVIFPVSNWIPNAENFEATVAKKRKVLAAGPVVIVWSLAGEYEPPVTQREFLHIVIHPLQSGLYRVRLVTRENRALTVGPLSDNMKLSKRVLGPMVRMTAIAATRQLQPETAILAPCNIRKNRIEELAKQYQRPMSFDDWMMNIMSSRLPPDLSAPAPASTSSMARIPVENLDGFSGTSTLTSTGSPMMSTHGSAGSGSGGSTSLAPMTTSASPSLSPSPSASQLNSSSTTPSNASLSTSTGVSSTTTSGSPGPSTSTGVTVSRSSSFTAGPPKAPLPTAPGGGPSSPGGNQARPQLQRNMSTSMPMGQPPPTPGGSLGVSGGATKTSAPPSPRPGDDGNRSRQTSTSEGSETGDTTPGRKLSTSSHASSPGASDNTDHQAEPTAAANPPIARYGSVTGATGPTPSTYKGPPLRTPPPTYQPTFGGGSAPNSPASTSTSTPPPSLGNVGQYGSVGSSGSSGSTTAPNSARKPSSGFGFWKRDKDKDKKPEEKKDPKKK